MGFFVGFFCPRESSCQRQSEQTDKRQPKEKRVKLTITFYFRHWGPSASYRQCRKSHYMLLLTHNKMVSSYPLRLEPYKSFPFPIVLRYLFFFFIYDDCYLWVQVLRYCKRKLFPAHLTLGFLELLAYLAFFVNLDVTFQWHLIFPRNHSTVCKNHRCQPHILANLISFIICHGRMLLLDFLCQLEMIWV